MLVPKITFVLIKDKQVVTGETIETDDGAIVRRISRIQDEGYDSCVAVFGEGAKWDITFPMSDSEIMKVAAKLERNL